MKTTDVTAEMDGTVETDAMAEMDGMAEMDVTAEMDGMAETDAILLNKFEQLDSKAFDQDCYLGSIKSRYNS